MTAAPVTTPRITTRLEACRVSLGWFNQFVKENDVETEYVAEGNVVSGLSRLEVCEGGEIIALFDGGDLDRVTILTKAPTEAMQLEAKRVIAESGV